MKHEKDAWLRVDFHGEGFERGDVMFIPPFDGRPRDPLVAAREVLEDWNPRVRFGFHVERVGAPDGAQQGAGWIWDPEGFALRFAGTCR